MGFPMFGSTRGTAVCPFLALLLAKTLNEGAKKGHTAVPLEYNMALGENMGSFESRPPQLRFFSSPGGKDRVGFYY